MRAVHLCDGWAQCPQRDDELGCDIPPCPSHCTCYGLAWFCTNKAVSHAPSHIHFLDARGSGTRFAALVNTTMLVYLNLERCGIVSMDLPQLQNLCFLHLADNGLTSIDWKSLTASPRLKELSLAGNPLVLPSVGCSRGNLSLPSLHSLDLSRITILYMDTKVIHCFANLQTFNVSDSHVLSLSTGFQLFGQLRTLDMRRCDLREFPQNIFQGLNNLRTVHSDNFKLCCVKVLPDGFHRQNCHSPSDELSSCDNLLRSDMYRVLLLIFASLSLTGNLSSLVYRTCVEQGSRKKSYNMFVINLCIADLLMGVYLAIIGVADFYYRNMYLWKDGAWKGSPWCSVAGFLGLLSNEVSAFMICLITLDRFLVLRFPFSEMRFGLVSSHVTSGVAWLVGFSLAAVPLLPVTSHWKFYSQTGICLPLPVTRITFPGHSYCFVVMIVLNFFFFLLIALGQLSIYSSVVNNRLSAACTTTTTSKDVTIARRLTTVAVSDFLCWFPIGLLGILSSEGSAISSEVNVAIAIIVLPLNSAINPFLYTLNIWVEQRRKRKECRLLEKLTKQDHGNLYSAKKVSSVSTEYEAAEVLRAWLESRLLQTGRIVDYIRNLEK